MELRYKTAEDELHNELGEYCRDIIEMDWGISVDEFIEKYWDEEVERFDV